MTPETAVRQRCRVAAIVTAALSVSAAACGGGARTVDVDGGAPDIAVLGDIVVAARPGQTVALRHAGEVVSGAEAPITHAFVGPGDRLPPIFAPQAGGLIPTPAVWGQCRGGDPATVTGACPILPADGPQSWDGKAYWSTGAMVPSETREIPLADGIAEGDHVLTCALHPSLRVLLRIGGDDDDGAKADPEAAVAAARSALQDEAVGADVTVTAGVETDGAYVAAFSPQTVRIPLGGSVTWRPGGRTPVDVVFGAAAEHEGENPLSLSHTTPIDGRPAGDTGAWDGRGELRSGFLSADPAAGGAAEKWTVTFARPGTYTYASRFGDQMIGTVVVAEASR